MLNFQEKVKIIRILLDLCKDNAYLYIIINNKVMKTTSIYVELIVRETEKAILVRTENKKASGCYTNNEFWLPKSQVSSAKCAEIHTGIDDELVIPMWLAYKLCDEGKISRIDF